MVKSDELGGRRTGVRHAGELGAGGAVALLIVSLIPEGSIDAFQSSLVAVILTAAFSTAQKLLLSSGFLSAIGRTGLVVLLVSSMGCAVFVGKSTPREFTGATGETIIACDIGGVALTLGDADICRNVEGGHISEPFAGVLSGLFETVARVIAGVFTGIGGAGAAISPNSE